MTQRIHPTVFTVLGLAGLLFATGCSVSREPRPTVAPTFSIHADQPHLSAASLWPEQTLSATTRANADDPLMSLDDLSPAVSLTTASLAELTDLLRHE